MAHHAKALAIVHKRLSNPIEATSQGTLGTVIAMACYSVSESPLLLSRVARASQAFSKRLHCLACTYQWTSSVVEITTRLTAEF